MKYIIFAGALVLTTAIAGEAIAACDGVQVTSESVPSLGNLLLGNTICQISPEKAQEEHHSGSILKDYKKGPIDPADPSSQIGNWNVSGSGVDTIVNYTYGASGFSYKVYMLTGTLGADNSTYEFCNAGTPVASVTLKTGFGSNTSYSPVCP
ncbi:MAG: hypothetical protein ABL919_07055 [Methylococcales bacterium]|nr:hypothetical protein [Methylococcaceae bacterium]